MTSLLPAENMALTVALAQVERGEHPTPNVTAVCVLALGRLREEWGEGTSATAGEPDLWTGHDGETAYLVTRWPDGTVEVATRSVAGGTRETWSPPVALVTA